MDEFRRSGLGLDYGVVCLVAAQPAWAELARHLGRGIQAATGDLVIAVEHIGSTAVPGLLAKPILDLAVGLARSADRDAVTARIEGLGWQFRGDAGGDGGLVFVLEESPRHRVAHAHGVEHGGVQWCDYLELRDLLRRDASARKEYENAKRLLADSFPSDRERYTAGKTTTVRKLLHRTLP